MNGNTDKLRKAFLTTLVVLFLLPQVSFACDCPKPDAASLFGANQRVFLGRVQNKFGTNESDATIKVTRIWKGDAAKTLEITTGDSLCGASLKFNLEYLFFVTDLNGKGRSTICNTFVKRDARQLIRWLKKNAAK